MSVRAAEQGKYERVWEIPRYRAACHSLGLWRSHRAAFPAGMESLLDIGCGTGHLMRVLNRAGVDAWGIDIAENCLDPAVAAECGDKFVVGCIWDMGLGRQFDFGVCADVMEHIPPEFVEQSLRRIAGTCAGTLFKIAHVPAHPWLGKGEPLHLTVKPAEWWVGMMEEIGGSVRVLSSVRRSGFDDSVMLWRAA